MVRSLMRAPIRALVGPVTAALVALVADDAAADSCSNPLTNTCVSSDSFWPNAGPQRFAAVGSTETTAERQVSFGLMTTYQSRPVVLRVASPGPGGSDQYAIDNQVNASFLFAYGVTDRLQLDVGLPITLGQDGAGTSPLTGGGDLRSTAVRDLRFGVAYAIVPRDRNDPEDRHGKGGAGHSWSLAARFATTAPVGDSGDFAGERTAVFVPSLAVDWRWKRLFAAGEIGARVRPVTEVVGARIGTQLTMAAGVGVDILPKSFLSLLLESHAYAGFVEQRDTQQTAAGIGGQVNGQRIIPAEWMLGVRSAPLLDGDVSFYAGGGGPFPGNGDVVTVPRFRFNLGLTFAPTRRDSDGDGVPDRIDRCPTVPGEKGGAEPGCPKAPDPVEPPAPEPKVQP